MNFSTDRDLLRLEPAIFNEVTFASQQRLHVTDGIVSGTTLTSASSDFEAAQVAAGDVVLIANVACEVIARVDANTLTVSLPRTDLSNAAIPPGDGSTLDVSVRTFALQATRVHNALLRKLRIDADDVNSPLSEDAIVSLSLLGELETLGTAAQAYHGAIAVGGDNVVLREKAATYRQRFDISTRAAVVLIDTDGDGVADTERRLGDIQLIRI